MKSLLWISGAMLLLALAPLPIGYYTLLRLVVTITAVLMALRYYNQEQMVWTIIFGLIALIFNPIIPVYLGDKNIWIPIDILTGLFFISHSFIKPNPQTD